MYFLRVRFSVFCTFLNSPLSFQCIPVTWHLLPHTHYIFIVVNLVMWISLLVANQKDPGFLARNTDDYHRSIKQIAYYDEWKSHRGETCC